MSTNFTAGKFQAQDATGALPFALLYTYAAGTTTPLATYTSQSGLSANSNPVVCDSNGQASVWLGSSAYHMVLKTFAGVTVWDVDNLAGPLAISDVSDTASAANGDALLGVKTTVTGSQATTQHQVNEERTSAFQFFNATQIAAVLAATGTAAAECSTGLQAALDGLASVTLPAGTYQVGTALQIKNGTARTSIRGEHRIRSILQPNLTSLASGPANVNAMFIVQDNNAHFCMERVRLTATNGYTGVGVYALEGGGGDTSGQCLFSGVFFDIWVDFGTTNSGFLLGGTQNSVFDTITFENMKGVFNLQGVGNGDNFYRNLSLYNCYDQLILQTADANGAFAMTVDGIHAYGHQRGFLFDVKNWTGATVSNIIFEPATGNLGTTGIGKWTSSSGLVVSNFYAKTRSGVPACAVGIELDTTSGRFINGSINADIGLKLSGVGAHDIEFVNVDFTNCTSAALQIAAAGSGTIRTRGCKFNDSTLSGFVNQVASSHNWYSYNDEFINAGLGGSAGARCIDVNTSGTVKLFSPRIGQNNGSAAAAYYIGANGSGTVDIYDPQWVGTPPTAYFSGTQPVNVHQTQPSSTAVVTAATYTVLPSDRDIVANRAGTVTLTLPAPVSSVGRRLNVRTVQAQTVVSATSNVAPSTSLTAGTAILAATAGKFAELVCDGTAWQVMGAN